ncbi:MAG: hypothetical protein IME94_03850 [Proteobacteria bacterium]|nr:hypothetical protein [Pseudomonadota bacterium]
MLKIKHSYNKSNKLTLLIILSLYAILFTLQSFAGNTYMKCWKNSEGVTECGNRVPREYYNQRIRSIDSRGITRNIKERGKTREELIAAQEAEKKAKALQEIEDETKRRKKMRDDILLKTYLTVDDILASMNNKLDLTASRMDIFKESIPVKKQKFDNLVKKAANMERAGKKVTDNLISELNALRTEIKNNKLQIKIEENKQANIKKEYRVDIERFVFLKTRQLINKAKTKQEKEKLHIALITCSDKNQCIDVWKQANKFVTEFSNTDIVYQTDTFIVSDSPEKSNDISMTLSLQADEIDDKKKIIVLNLRCHPERKGREFCSSDKVKNTLSAFNNFNTP